MIKSFIVREFIVLLSNGNNNVKNGKNEKKIQCISKAVLRAQSQKTEQQQQQQQHTKALYVRASNNKNQKIQHHEIIRSVSIFKIIFSLIFCPHTLLLSLHSSFFSERSREKKDIIQIDRIVENNKNIHTRHQHLCAN